MNKTKNVLLFIAVGIWNSSSIAQVCDINSPERYSTEDTCALTPPIEGRNTTPPLFTTSHSAFCYAAKPPQEQCDLFSKVEELRRLAHQLDSLNIELEIATNKDPRLLTAIHSCVGNDAYGDGVYVPKALEYAVYEKVSELATEFFEQYPHLSEANEQDRTLALSKNITFVDAVNKIGLESEKLALKVKVKGEANIKCLHRKLNEQSQLTAENKRLLTAMASIYARIATLYEQIVVLTGPIESEWYTQEYVWEILLMVNQVIIKPYANLKKASHLVIWGLDLGYWTTEELLRPKFNKIVATRNAYALAGLARTFLWFCGVNVNNPAQDFMTAAALQGAHALQVYVGEDVTNTHSKLWIKKAHEITDALIPYIMPLITLALQRAWHGGAQHAAVD